MYINLENTQSNIMFIGKTTKFMAGTGLSRPGDQIGCYLHHNVLLLLYFHSTTFFSFYASSYILYRF